MKFVEWDEKYSVGVASIDTQHKRLIEFTNLLFDACQEGPEAAGSAFRATLKDVVAYVKEHFRDEEALMQQHEYPEYPYHKKEHEKFIYSVLEHVAAFEAGKKFVPNNFVRILRDWLLEHIAVTDHRYTDFFHGKGVR